MEKSAKMRASASRGIVVVGLLLIVFFWVTDSFIDSRFENTSFLTELTRPHTHELVIRCFAITVLILLIGYILKVNRKGRVLEEQLEQAVITSQAERRRSEAIVASIGDAVSIQDTDLRILYQNEAHKLLKGDHAGEFCYRAYQGSESVCEGCHLVLSFRDGTIHRLEKQDRTVPGRTVEIISSPLRDQDGRIIAGIETVRDVTRRKNLENMLARQVAAMEASMDGIAILDEEEKYTFLNPAHAKIYGYDSPEDLIGKNWRILYRDEDAAIFEREVMPVLAAAGKWLGEATGRKRDGNLFLQEVSLNLLDGGGIICVVRDITERKVAEKEIRRLNSDLTERANQLALINNDLEAFNYSLSHDLRNPLARMYAAAQVIEETYAQHLDEEGRFLVRCILEAGETMEGLIDAMLILGRVSRSEMSPLPTDLSEVAAGIVADLKTAHKNCRAEFVIAPHIIADCDPQFIRVALENLIGNAWKYSQKVGQPLIEFGVADRNGVETYYVRDNGAGFDMKDADRLFKPFERLHKNSEFSGIGIGLATVRRIIDRHEGRIWGESEVGRGAVFYFTLPQKQPGAGFKNPPSAP